MLEKMVAEMLGISPQEMTEMLSGMQTLLKDGVAKLNSIHEQNAQIIAHLGVKDDAGSADNSD